MKIKKAVLAGLLLTLSVSFTGCGPGFGHGEAHNHMNHAGHSASAR